MELIEHTVAWCRGEVFEGRLLALVGAAVGVIAGCFSGGGTTSSTRATS